MSGEDAVKRIKVWTKTLSRMLGNPKFEYAAGLVIAGNPHFQEDPFMYWSSDHLQEGFEMDERELSTLCACIQVACKLVQSSTAKPEELAGDAKSWDRLISEFGKDSADMHTLRSYAQPSYPSLTEDPWSNLEGETENAHLAFTKYAFKGNAHEHLLEQLQENRRKVNYTTHYSQYVAVVQASGVGKSRIVMQLSELGVYICYCSLAGRHSSASPPRTGKLADRLSTTYDEYEEVLYFKAWLNVLYNSRKITPNLWKQQQLPNKDGSAIGDIAQQVYDEWEMLLAKEMPIDYESKRDRDDFNIRICITELKRIKGRIKGICRVLFVFDEARGLQTPEPKTGLMSKSPFYQVRRALRMFFQEDVFFAVFLDTAARVSNLLPNRSNEDSERPMKSGLGLLKPIYCLPNMSIHQPSLHKTAQWYRDAENWLLYGRPLWAARWSSDPSSKRLLAFAMEKLLCTVQGDFAGMQVDVPEGKVTQSQAIALLSAAAGLSICPRSMLAESLAASHMNLILRVHEDTRERRIYVGLSAEPILAEAVGSILGTVNVQVAALKHLDEAYMAGYVTPGPRGEFVTKFILVAAVWQLKEDWILHPIPVQHF